PRASTPATYVTVLFTALSSLEGPCLVRPGADKTHSFRLVPRTGGHRQGRWDSEGCVTTPAGRAAARDRPRHSEPLLRRRVGLYPRVLDRSRRTRPECGPLAGRSILLPPPLAGEGASKPEQRTTLGLLAPHGSLVSLRETATLQGYVVSARRPLVYSQPPAPSPAESPDTQARKRGVSEPEQPLSAPGGSDAGARPGGRVRPG